MAVATEVVTVVATAAVTEVDTEATADTEVMVEQGLLL